MKKKEEKVVVEVVGSWSSLVGDSRLVSTPESSLFEGDGRGFEDWFWCLHCEKAYQFKEMILIIDHRIVAVEKDCLGDLWMCAGFPDCGGSLLDTWTWKDHLASTGEGWLPDNPVRGVSYPMYGGSCP